MRLWLSFVTAIICLHLISANKLEVQPDAGSEVAQLQLLQIQKQTKHMKYGKCWTKALEQLQNGCRNLTDEMQRRIAYAFARCHLQSAGREIPECEEDKPVSECTNDKVLKDTPFNTYTEFFTHTQQICFHLQSQVWHEATENTISRLADNSAEVASSLEQSSAIALEMVERQNVTLQNQEEMLRNERLLRENMHKSVLDVQRSHEETKNVIREQRVLFAEVFDRVAALQKTVLGEFTSVYTFGFYIGASLLAYVLTSTSRTSSARIWLFVLITVNFFTERAVVNYHLAPSSSEEGMFVESAVLPETVYADLWICRKIFTGLAMLTMLICVIRYKDYNRINNSLLNEIKRQNLELQVLLKEQGVSNLNSFNSHLMSPQTKPNGDVVLYDVTNKALSQTEAMQSDDSTLKNSDPQVSILANSTSIMTPSDYDFDEDDDDKTFVGDEISSDSDTSSLSTFYTSHSRRSSEAGDNITALMRSYRRSSTPSSGRPGSSHSSRRSSTSSTFSLLEHLNESIVETEGVIVGGHNLRRRRSIQGRNPAYEKETVSEFMGAVARVTARQKRFLH
ncbi:unnamed protein product [Clavelina lepadiformis]|uniref:Protein brambleberry n=1 Tax=Clavelina lepadiformis TaxID=159417 RepID=A0ABP0G4T3_CLALP